MPLGEEAHLDSKESRHRYDVMRRLLTGCLVILFVVLVFQTVLEIQIQQNNRNNGETQRAAKTAQEAAERTDKALTSVLNQLNTPENQRLTQQGRQRIINIEDKLCGGPCPDSERKP